MVNSNTEHPPTRLNTLIVWGGAALCIAATLGGLALYAAAHSGALDDAPWYLIAQAMLLPVIAAVILSNRPGHMTGAMLLMGALIAGLFFICAGYNEYGIETGRLWLPLLRLATLLKDVTWLGAICGLALSILYFPTGRLPSARWRWVPWLMAVSQLLMVTVWVYASRMLTIEQVRYGDKFVTDPLYSYTNKVIYPCVLLSVLGAVVSVLFRLRRARGVERQQLKWFSLSTMLYLGVVIVELLGSALIGKGPITAVAGELGFNIVQLLLTVLFLGTIVMAIVRHKAFDIDVIIRKTLQWTLVSLLLGAVYVGTVLGLQEVFKRLTGQTSEVAVALSTLALAVAFMPIRRAAQNLIDKRFYRKRYNAEQVIEAYAASIKDEVDVNVIHQKMLGVLADTLQPKKIILFLAQPNPNAHPHPRFAPLPPRERE